MNKLKKCSIILCGLLLATFFTACGKKVEPEVTTIEPIEKSEILMGTVIRVKLYDSDNETILDEVFNKIKSLESLLSINENGTEVDKINDKAGTEPVKVSDDTFEVIKQAIHYSDLSSGKFDLTIGPLVKLWSIGLPEQKLPTQKEIDSVIPLTNYKDVVLNDTDKTVFLNREKMKIDLGGIAKGYTADVISEILTKDGVHSAIIDLGGNIFAHGKKVNGDSWNIGIQNPFSERGELVGTIKETNKSIVTSGIYERYFEENGVKYHHILNPETGYPYDNEIAGVSIISDTSTAGDALSTSIFAMGVENGLKFVESQPGVDAIFITKNKEVYMTSGIKDNFELKDENFTLK